MEILRNEFAPKDHDMIDCRLIAVRLIFTEKATYENYKKHFCGNAIAAGNIRTRCFSRISIDINEYSCDIHNEYSYVKGGVPVKSKRYLLASFKEKHILWRSDADKFLLANLGNSHVAFVPEKSAGLG